MKSIAVLKWTGTSKAIALFYVKEESDLAEVYGDMVVDNGSMAYDANFNIYIFKGEWRKVGQ